ncbi:MAG: DUF255 domain-containing protein [Limnobacter sp.]|nr:DUF255 domain-containing protein [Limnobacter sp.]
MKVEAVEAELVARETSVVPGQPLTLGLRLQHDPHWHSYWRNPGDSGLPTQLELSLPEGFVAGSFDWPAPQRLFIPPLANYGYEGEVVLPLRVSVPAGFDGDSLRVVGKASWLMCSDVCIPGDAELALTLPVSRDGSTSASRHAALFDDAHRRLPAQTLEVQVGAAGERLSLGLPEALASAEFFPYHEGLIANAAPQALHAIEAEGQPERRLELRLSDEGARRVADPAERLRAAEGVLVAGDRIFELTPVVAQGPLDAGVEISRVAGAEAAPAPGSSAGRAGGAFSSLFSRGAGGASTAGPAAGAPGTQATGAPGSEGSSASASGAAVDAGGQVGGSLAGLLVAALFAAVGGLILNLMPCVFPVIGLKVLGFAGHGSAGDPARQQSASRASRNSALAFSAGVLTSFWLLAVLLLGLRAAGHAVGWGFQLQSPAFVAAMALLFVAIGLNFSGVWEFGLGMTRLGQYEQRKGSTTSGSFGAGVLAVLVATPCTAPFMGSALGYTLSASVVETLVVFTALGLGMALPYLLLGSFPAWLRHLPRPGRWMESFRQALAFPMYATAAWLGWVLGRQAGIDATFALAIGAVLLGLAAWLYGRFVQQAQPVRVDPVRARHRRGFAASLAVLSLAAGLLVAWPDQKSISGQPARSASAGEGFDPRSAGLAGVAADAGAAGRVGAPGAGAGETGSASAFADPASGTSADPAAWYPWSPDAVARASAAGRPVFVDFTAAWCVSCQVNKKLVLDREAVVQAMQAAEVLRLRADWTSRDEEIGAELARHGRNGVPLYLLYRPGSTQPTVLPELLTPGIVAAAIESVARQ